VLDAEVDAEGDGDGQESQRRREQGLEHHGERYGEGTEGVSSGYQADIKCLRWVGDGSVHVGNILVSVEGGPVTAVLPLSGSRDRGWWKEKRRACMHPIGTRMHSH